MYTPHPIAQMFPRVEGEEFEKFVEDIRSNGLQNPIAVHGEYILDGLNRQRACEAAGVEPRYVDVGNVDPLSYITSMNLRRRHLTTEQRAHIAADMANLAWGSNPGKGYVVTEEGSNDPSSDAITIEQAARAMNVSPKSVKRAKKMKKENPEEHERAKRGEKAKKPASTRIPWAKYVSEKLGLNQGTVRTNKVAYEKLMDQQIPSHFASHADADAFCVEFQKRCVPPAKAVELTNKAAYEAACSADELPKTGKQKLEAAINQHKRTLDLEFESRVSREVEDRLNRILPHLEEKHRQYVAVTNAYRGVFTNEEYKALRQFLHPDKHHGNEAKAQRLFDMVSKKETELCGAKTKEGIVDFPRTASELMARRMAGRPA